MASKQPFARRILIAFVVMATLVSGLVSLTIIGVVHFIEEHLVSEELHGELDTILQDDIKLGRAPRLDLKTLFYASHLPQYPIPSQFDALKQGFAEVVDDNQAFYVYTQVIDGQRYLLVQEQHEFEAREQTLFKVVLAGFLLAVFGACALGVIMARTVMAPLRRLAQQVAHRDQLHVTAPALATEYPNDEIGQLAVAFDKTLGQVRQSLERERLFTSDVSHELRTPLMVIASSCELLQEGILAPHQKEQIRRIERASAEMRDLVQTFLQLAADKPSAPVSAGCNDFSETANVFASAGFSTPVPLAESTTLAAIAAEQKNYWTPRIDDKNIEFRCVEEGADRGHYNVTFLRTVIANLLRNAVHYTERGHIYLILSDGGFRVEDSGTGIPIDQHEHIFKSFMRGSQARGEGWGLGLSLVKRICENQGWTISVHSIAAGGVCFSVSFNG
ncbi:MAG: integral rane sensor signal transduction histidine kinase [Verrucomicrobiaceae bacterium]|nr:integral rane sensor signal transduction histidine kinase [Verrucomicrobiaceae bacterium]